ncbi:PREDICTED: protein ARV1-like [Priapulus caudatus]|uniref:Protein ARV n=1 Tax=Priapulus caudatus TaxID=37621 RepID=A0ABM1DT80_PRICU|nr:PREDICTED: protein ARV1-like [Priapulus caudatus]
MEKGVIRRTTEEQRYKCINCGHNVPELCKKYNANVIKLAHCDLCGKQVDKYIEFDPVIIFLDAVLQKKEPYRHVIFNTEFKAHWRLVIFFIICDAYVMWTQEKSLSEAKTSNYEPLFYAIEGRFYNMCMKASIEILVFFSTVIICSELRFQLRGPAGSRPRPSIRSVLDGIIISSFGKFLAIPAIIWGQSSNVVYLTLTELLIFTSNVQAFTVTWEARKAVSIAIIGCGFLMRYCLHPLWS